MINFVSITNFKSVKNQTINLTDGITHISGETIGDDDSKNRTGKTTILDAISWCLFGDFEGCTGNQYVRYGTDKCVVAIEYNSDIYGDVVIMRSNKINGNKNQYAQSIKYIDGEGNEIIVNKPADFKTMINNIFKVDYDIFKVCCRFTQNSISMLLNSGSSFIRKFILSVIGDDYTDDIGRINNASKKNDLAIESCKTKINMLNQNVESYNNNVKRIETIRDEIVTLEKIVNDLGAIFKTGKRSPEEIVDIIEKTSDENDSLRIKLARTNAQILNIRNIKKDIEAIQIDVMSIGNIEKQLESISHDIAIEEKKKNKLEQNKNDLASRLSNAQRYIELVKTGSCPFGIECDKVSGVSNDLLSKYKKGYEKIDKDYSECIANLYTINEKIAMMNNNVKNLSNNIESIRIREKSIDALVKNTAPLKDLLNEVDEISKKIEANEKTIKLYEKMDVDSFKEFIKAKENIERKKSEILTIEGRNASIADDIERIKTLDVELTELEIKADDIKAIRNVFTDTGIIAYKVNDVKTSIEHIMNDKVVDMFFDNATVKLVVDPSESSKFDILLCQNDNEISVSTLSGAQKTIVVMALQYALFMYSRSNVDFLFFDEVVQTCDKINRRIFVNFLENISGDVSQALVISHFDDFNDSFDQKINAVYNSEENITEYKG